MSRACLELTCSGDLSQPLYLTNYHFPVIFPKGGEKGLYYKSALYIKDMAILKDYGGKKYKLTLLKTYRQSGFEIERKIVEKGTVNEEKLECNIVRARQKIFEYALCNPWELFVNLTLDARKYDRFNLKKYISDLTQWLRNYGKRHNCRVKYLFIPEQHKDGAWHIHGLLMGLPTYHLSDFIPGKHPQKLIDEGYKNWEAYNKKFGYVSVGEIKNHEATSKYLTKYVTKDMASNNKDLGAHLYYCSNGLEIASVIRKGTMSGNIIPDYENEYIKVQWFDNKGTALGLFD